VVPIGGKQLLLFGGYVKADTLSCKEVHILHTDEMKWQAVDKKTCGTLFEAVVRSGHAATMVGDNGIFVSGGFLHSNYVPPCYWIDVRVL